MKKKNGFTLVELLAVVVIMAIIALVAVPNVVSMLERNKKKQMVSDAKEMFNKFQNKITLGTLECKDTSPCSSTLKNLGLSGKQDGYGDTYDDTSSITYNNNNKTFTITLKTDKHCLNKTGITNSENFSITIEDVLDVSDGTCSN